MSGGSGRGAGGRWRQARGDQADAPGWLPGHQRGCPHLWPGRQGRNTLQRRDKHQPITDRTSRASMAIPSRRAGDLGPTQLLSCNSIRTHKPQEACSRWAATRFTGQGRSRPPPATITSCVQPDKRSDGTRGGANAAAPEQKLRANFKKQKTEAARESTSRMPSLDHPLTLSVQAYYAPALAGYFSRSSWNLTFPLLLACGSSSDAIQQGQGTPSSAINSATTAASRRRRAAPKRRATAVAGDNPYQQPPHPGGWGGNHQLNGFDKAC